MAYKAKIDEVCIADAVSNAYSEWQSLRDEMEEKRGAMEEKFSQTEKYATVESTKDSLDGFCDNEPEVDENIGNRRIEVTTQVNKNKRRGPSRDVRNSNACMTIEKVIEILQSDYEDDDAASELADTLQEALDEAQGLEFPGMY